MGQMSRFAHVLCACLNRGQGRTTFKDFNGSFADDNREWVMPMCRAHVKQMVYSVARALFIYLAVNAYL